MSETPHQQRQEKLNASVPKPFDTSDKGFKMLADGMWNDFNDKKVLLPERFKQMSSLQAEVEKRYRKGDKLLDKKGTVWVWKTRDGSQRGEVIPLFLKQPKENFSLAIQKEIENYSKDQQLIAQKKDQRETIRNIEGSKGNLYNSIVKDFPEVANIAEYASFWSQVYSAIDDGCYTYQFAKEFSQNAKIKNPTLRKQVREMGFVLINPRTKVFVWFTGGPGGKPVKGEVENAPSDNQKNERGTVERVRTDHDVEPSPEAIEGGNIRGKINDKMKSSGMTDVLASYRENISQESYTKIISHVDSFVAGHPELSELHAIAKPLVEGLHEVMKNGGSKNDTMHYLSEHVMEQQKIQSKFEQLRKDGKIPEEDMGYYAEILDSMFGE